MKSDVKTDQLELVQAIYRDACAKCVANVSDLRDLNTIRSRVEKEGLSFLTLTLPAFASDLENSLRQGFIDSNAFPRFEKIKTSRRKRGPIPVFLQGMVSLLFNHETGRIFDDNSQTSEAPVIIDSIRQICLAFKKMELPCTPERTARALANYTEIEHEFQLFSLPPEDLDEFRQVSFMLWSRMLVHLRTDMLVPRHGPGATAERISGNQKFLWRRWHERLEPYFPFIDSAYAVSAVDSEIFRSVTFVNQDDEDPVRVITVPKTLKGPRIIAIEPVCMMYTQKAIQRELYRSVESAHSSEGHVNFTDQSVNQQLALIASKTSRLATIDLSDASDRVPRDLALEMFQSNPDLRDAIDACRSTSAKMPNGVVISPLSKFASMGSALCFPVESMYFYTICVAALLRKHNLPVSYANCYTVSRDLYVYGDDILCPTDDATTVLEYLQKYNCKVNPAKSFWSGNFRESCGVDAYNGELVTPIYLRKMRPENRRQATRIVSWVETANLFYKKGYWSTAELMWKTCERYIGHLPYVSDTSGLLGRISYLGYRSVTRWNYDYQRFEVKGWAASPVDCSDIIEGYPALQKSLLSLEGKPSGSGMAPLDATPVREDHLERTERHGHATLKRRWAPV